MSFKLLNVAITIFILLSTCLSSNSNAGLIVGDIYSDGSGIKWQYVGLFDLVGDNNPKNEDAPHWTVASPVNGLEAAAYLFNGDINDFAISAFALTFDVETIVSGAEVVNHLSWYDGNFISISRAAENILADKDGDSQYDFTEDLSAWVDDRAFSGDYINYVFKRTAVPEPSSIAIFGLAMFALGIRRLKNQ